MAIYPKQLQKFVDVSLASGPGGTKVRENTFGDHVVLGNGSTVVGDYTVNKILRFIEEDYYGYITTIDHTKHAERFRPFDTDFGDKVVFANGTVLNADQVANELIEVMRVLYDIDRARGANNTGKATSIQA